MKNFKRIAFLVLSIIMLFTTSAMMLGCGEPEVNTITVTLNYPDGTPVNGTTDGITDGMYLPVSVQICTVDEAGETLSCVPKQVNEEGKAVFNIDELPRNEGDKYKLSGTVKPEGYTATEIIFDNEKEITITLVLAE